MELQEKFINILHLDYVWALDDRLNDGEVDKLFKGIADSFINLIKQEGYNKCSECGSLNEAKLLWNKELERLEFNK